MSTNEQIIADALRDIGVLAETESLTPEQATHGLRKMNGLLASLAVETIADAPSPQTNYSDDFPLGEDYEMGVTAMLAVLLAPTYGREAPPTVKAIADAQMRRFLRQGLYVERREASNIGKLPEGGFGRYNITTDI